MPPRNWPHHTGEGVGGLLNATFGNAAELIIAIMALRQGLYSVVKASLTGSIIGNILLVLGAAVLAGGLKHKHQSFNVTGARAQATLLTLAAIALVMPAAFHASPARTPDSAKTASASPSPASCWPPTDSTCSSRWARTSNCSQGGAHGAARSQRGVEPEAFRPDAGRRHAVDRLGQRDPGRLGGRRREGVRHDQRLHRRDRGRRGRQRRRT